MTQYTFNPDYLTLGTTPAENGLIQARPSGDFFGTDTGIVSASNPVSSKVLRFTNDKTRTFNAGANRWLRWSAVEASESIETLHLFRRNHATNAEILSGMRMRGNDESFSTSIYGSEFNPAWANKAPGLRYDLGYGDVNNFTAKTNSDRKTYQNQTSTINIGGFKHKITWTGATSKYDTTYYLFRECEEVIIDDIHIFHTNSDWIGYHTLFFEGCGRVVIRNSSFHGAVYMHHIRLEGCEEIIIDNCEIAGYDYSGSVKCGGGIWIENGSGTTYPYNISYSNPRPLSWHSITNCYFHDRHTFSGGISNRDGILVHSGRGLIYSCLVKNWSTDDGGMDLSHRQTHSGYTNRHIQVENCEIDNCKWFKVVGGNDDMGPNCSITMTNCLFKGVSLQHYLGGYYPLYEYCVFEEKFSLADRFILLLNMRGNLYFRHNIIKMSSTLNRFVHCSNPSYPGAEEYLKMDYNTYYMGTVNYWVDSSTQQLTSWSQWRAWGQDPNSTITGTSGYTPAVMFTDRLEAYGAGIRNNATDIRGRMILNSETVTDAGASAHNITNTVDEWLYVRTKIDSASYQVKARTWRQGTSEPINWTLENTDVNSNILSGGTGLSIFLAEPETVIDLAYFSVGTEGDSAPLVFAGYLYSLALAQSNTDPFNYYGRDSVGTPITRTVNLTQTNDPATIDSTVLIVYLISELAFNDIKIRTANADAGVTWLFSSDGASWVEELFLESVPAQGATQIFIKVRVVNDGSITENKQTAKVQVWNRKN